MVLLVSDMVSEGHCRHAKVYDVVVKVRPPGLACRKWKSGVEKPAITQPCTVGNSIAAEFQPLPEKMPQESESLVLLLYLSCT